VAFALSWPIGFFFSQFRLEVDFDPYQRADSDTIDLPGSEACAKKCVARRLLQNRGHRRSVDADPLHDPVLIDEQRQLPTKAKGIVDRRGERNFDRLQRSWRHRELGSRQVFERFTGRDALGRRRLCSRLRQADRRGLLRRPAVRCELSMLGRSRRRGRRTVRLGRCDRANRLADPEDVNGRRAWRSAGRRLRVAVPRQRRHVRGNHH
jgi:hypothetical protein